MKLHHYYNRYFVINIFFSILLSKTVVGEVLDDKVKNLTLELRCMTCQNQSIYDSEAEFSNDIKKIVRSKFQEGKTEREIKEFLVDRYGEYILFKPMLNYKNLLLWAFPFILLAFSLFFFLYKLEKNKHK